MCRRWLDDNFFLQCLPNIDIIQRPWCANLDGCDACSSRLKFKHRCRKVPGVVEEAAVPQAVLASGRGVEETRVRAVEAVQAVLCVLGGVAVDDVQQHHDAHRMGHVYQLLQLVGGTVATENTHKYTHRSLNKDRHTQKEKHVLTEHTEWFLNFTRTQNPNATEIENTPTSYVASVLKKTGLVKSSYWNELETELFHCLNPQ